MELAFSKVKITPREPAYLCGYSHRKEKYIGIHDDLFVFFFALKKRRAGNLYWLVMIC